MSTLSIPRPETSDTARLAADLGEVLDELLDRTATGLVLRLHAHGLSPVHARILRELDRSPSGLDHETLVARTGLHRAALETQLRMLDDLGLLAADPGPALTRGGRSVIRELDRARREELRTFIEELHPTQRRRVEAAVHLLSGELDRLEEPAATREHAHRTTPSSAARSIVGTTLRTTRSSTPSRRLP